MKSLLISVIRQSTKSFNFKYLINISIKFHHVKRQAILWVAIPAVLVVGVIFGVLVSAFGQKHAIFLDNLHWTISQITAAILAWIGFRFAPKEDRKTLWWFASGFTLLALGQVSSCIELATGRGQYPSSSDFYICA
ncbi:MAG: hypothetical protein EXS25_10025 [Pedosphaera sp.]|nr:hypothetical protein [Pedosphaera sp.]